MTILFEFEGWVITDTYMITHGCLKRRSRQMEPKSYPKSTFCSWFCPTCTEWMPDHVAERLSKTLTFIRPDDHIT